MKLCANGADDGISSRRDISEHHSIHYIDSSESYTRSRLNNNMARMRCVSLFLLYTSISTVTSTSTFVRASRRPALMQTTIAHISRGGSSGSGSGDDESDDLDSYVNQLIADVSDDVASNSNIDRSDGDGVTPCTRSSKKKRKQKQKRRKKKSSSKSSVQGGKAEKEEDPEIREEMEDAIVEAAREEEAEADEQLEASSEKGKEDDDAQIENEESTSVSSPSSSSSSPPNTNININTNKQPILRPTPPPNGLQRFLLSQGYIGRTLAACTLLISEFTHRYLPEVYRIVTSLSPDAASKRGPGGSRDTRKKQEGVHSQYAAFASGSSVGGKKISKDRKKEMDQVALNKLKNMHKGGVKSGKYAHLSTAFMTKFNLGKYAEEAKMFESIIAPLEDRVEGSVDESEEEDDDEDEEDWVVQALSGKEDQSSPQDEEEHDFLNVEPTVSIGTNGASIGLDLNIKFASRGKKKKNPQSVMEAARGSKSISKDRKDVRVKGSDKDGGGGVLGILRAAGANSGVSSRILGAYPGDAVPIEEAASKYGVIELAERYGYGDWSDDEESDEEDNWTATSEKRGSGKKRRKSSNDGEKRKRKSRTKPDVSFSFDIGASSSASTRQRSPKLKSSPARRRASLTSVDTPRAKASSLLGELSHDTRVRRPMERTIEKTNGGKRVSRDELRGQLSSRRGQSSLAVPVQAPMRRTAGLKKKDDHSNSD